LLAAAVADSGGESVVQVDSARKRGVLLEAVQVLADLDLSINKAYISSDGRWFMDVFHVTDRLGRKLTDDSVITYIEQVGLPPSSALLGLLDLAVARGGGRSGLSGF
jgi:UTP:GlnB (protein PII) uridylyltransferase